MRRAAELHWVGLESTGAGRLKAVLRVEGDRHARVTVTLTVDGRILDVQANDAWSAGSTGDEALDDAVRDMVQERVVAARDAHAFGEAVRARNARRSRR